LKPAAAVGVLLGGGSLVLLGAVVGVGDVEAVPISAHTTRLPANAMTATLREVGWLIITPVGT
jgi:hypothetical protein